MTSECSKCGIQPDDNEGHTPMWFVGYKDAEICNFCADDLPGYYQDCEKFRAEAERLEPILAEALELAEAIERQLMDWCGMPLPYKLAIRLADLREKAGIK